MEPTLRNHTFPWEFFSVPLMPCTAPYVLCSAPESCCFHSALKLISRPSTLGVLHANAKAPFLCLCLQTAAHESMYTHSVCRGQFVPVSARLPPWQNNAQQCSPAGPSPLSFFFFFHLLELCSSEVVRCSEGPSSLLALTLGGLHPHVCSFRQEILCSTIPLFYSDKAVSVSHFTCHLLDPRFSPAAVTFAGTQDINQPSNFIDTATQPCSIIFGAESFDHLSLPASEISPRAS